MELTRGYLGLIGAVIRSGLNENLEYPLTTDGRYWCSLGNLDPEYVFKRATTAFDVPYVQMANIRELHDTHGND
jgi:hypothetical protein